MRYRGWRAQVAGVAMSALALALLPGTGNTAARAAASGRPQAEQRDADGRVVRSPNGKRRIYQTSPKASRPRLTRARAGRPAVSTGARYVSAEPDAPSLTLEWNHAALGVGIGLTGLFAADVDADGTVEIVAGGGGGGFGANQRWYVLSHQGGVYDQEFASLPYPSGVGAVRVAQVDADAPLEVVVGSGTGVFVYDGASHALERTLALPSGALAIVSLEVGDVDADGSLEVVASDGTDVFILNGANGSLEWRGTGLGGVDLAVGQIDADAGLEIVVANGTSTGHVIDGKTHVGQWSTAFGRYVCVADLDGDGLGEVAAGFDWSDMIVYEGDTHAVRYTVPMFNLAAVGAADVDGNGTLELLYGDAQWGSVHVLNGSTGAPLWAVSNPEHSVTDIAAGDVDGDGVREVVWGAGHTSSGPDRLYVADGVTHAIEWQSLDISGPFYGLDYGDVDGDGEREILYAAVRSDSGYGDGLYFVHDATTKALEYQSPEPTDLDWTGLWRIRSANVDADPQREIFFTTSRLYTGILIGQDGLTHAEQWRATTPDGLAFRSLQVADVDGDGVLEVVAGMERQHTGAPGVYVDVYDAATGALEWRSPNIGASWGSLSLLRLANVDDDPQLEIVVGAPGAGLWVVDPVEQALQLAATGVPVTALDTPDRDGDGRAEIVIGTDVGDIQVLERVRGAVTETLGSYGGRIDGLVFRDLSGDSNPELLFVVAGRLRVADGASGRLVLSTGFLGDNAGALDSLVVGDVVGNGRTKALLNDGMGGLLLIDLAPGSDTQAPTVALTSPSPGVQVEGAITLQATAADDWGVERVEFYVDGGIVATDAREPFSALWDTVPFDAGPHTLEARAYDGAGHVTSSAPVTVSVKGATGDALYDFVRRAPTCAKPAAYCDSGSLLVGRWEIGPEPHYPNTVNGSCGDGGWGWFHFDASNDRLRVFSLDGTPLAPGKRVRVEATVFVGPRNPSGSPQGTRRRAGGYWFDLFAAANASAPSWFHVATVAPTPQGLQTLSAEYTLPAGPLQVVRARVRYFGRAVPCEWGPWNDHDDLVFTVK